MRRYDIHYTHQRWRIWDRVLAAYHTLDGEDLTFESADAAGGWLIRAAADGVAGAVADGWDIWHEGDRWQAVGSWWGQSGDVLVADTAEDLAAALQRRERHVDRQLG